MSKHFPLVPDWRPIPVIEAEIAHLRTLDGVPGGARDKRIACLLGQIERRRCVYCGVVECSGMGRGQHRRAGEVAQ